VTRLILALLLLLLPVAAPAQPQTGGGRELYTSLRERALHTTIDDLGIRIALTDQAREPVVYGVVMEMAIDGETATLAAFITGDASLYLSTGGGWIGGIGQEQVATAARAFIEAAQAADFNNRPAVTVFPRPAPGQVHFFLLTSGGVLQLTAPEDALQGGGHALTRLYLAGHAVITGFRETEERRGSGN
jgi:hypothetical protein